MRGTEEEACKEWSRFSFLCVGGRSVGVRVAEFLVGCFASPALFKCHSLSNVGNSTIASSVILAGDCHDRKSLSHV